MKELFVVKVERDFSSEPSNGINITISTDDIGNGLKIDLSLRDFNSLFDIDNEIYNLRVIARKFNLDIADLEIFSSQLLIGSWEDISEFWICVFDNYRIKVRDYNECSDNCEEDYDE